MSRVSLYRSLTTCPFLFLSLSPFLCFRSGRSGRSLATLPARIAAAVSGTLIRRRANAVNCSGSSSFGTLSQVSERETHMPCPLPGGRCARANALWRHFTLHSRVPLVHSLQEPAVAHHILLPVLLWTVICCLVAVSTNVQAFANVTIAALFYIC